MRLGVFNKKCLPVLLGIVLLGIGGFVVLKRNPTYPVPVLWKADVGSYLDTSTPFVLGPDSVLLASTYTNLLELDRAGVLGTNVTRGVHGFRVPRHIAVEADGTFYHLFHGQGAQSTLRAQKPDGSELWQTTAFRLSRSAPPVVANDGTIYFNVDQ